MALEMEIDTRLGRRKIDPDKIIRFPRGLAGFEDMQDFILLQLRPDAPMLILQSTSHASLGLLVADPYCFLPDYNVSIGNAEKSLLGLDDDSDRSVLVTVAIPAGKPEEAALNLTGPIVINHKLRLGLQIPQVVEGPQQVNIHSLKPETSARPAERQQAPEKAQE